MKWEAIKVPWDFWHPIYDAVLDSSTTPLLVHARVYWDLKDNDGWYYVFPGKIGFGIHGPFKNQKEAMEVCENKIRGELMWLLTFKVDDK